VPPRGLRDRRPEGAPPDRPAVDDEDVSIMPSGRAFLGGVLGGAVALTMLAGARLAGLQVDLLLALGDAAGIPRGTRPWFLGFGEALLLAGLIGLVYGRIFRALHVRGGWRVGAAIGAVHASVTGILLGLVPRIGSLPAPGFFLVNLGLAGVGVELTTHLMFGAIVGVFCGNAGGQRAGPGRGTGTARSGRPADDAHRRPPAAGSAGVRLARARWPGRA
jgi:hypothetical protein